ncbi:imidazole glycerol phosphate synthase subunit HisH [Vibrio penaeicida]|uniref:imidazole glycerol phosphate synthase subunit HisH n=1 Tax=Vibrio penaeicida TaxID=104609 RepID=UPI000CE9BB5F|nr:imidazole glycerol phosphate synthase subunit HisH [Vibrio penaeicida]
MVHIIDYGVGNIQAFLNVFKRLGIPCKRATSVQDLTGSTHLILPGVGSFDHAMTRFSDSGLLEKVEELVEVQKVPVLGICVGMQMLATSSEEGCLPGLNWIPGRVRSFGSCPQSEALPMPHMGWNKVVFSKPSPLFKDFPEDPESYFLHSYFFDCDYEESSLAKADYGLKFDCIVNSGNVYGIQCHPEKSHQFGETILKNFAEL